MSIIEHKDIYPRYIHGACHNNRYFGYEELLSQPKILQVAMFMPVTSICTQIFLRMCPLSFSKIDSCNHDNHTFLSLPLDLKMILLRPISLILHTGPNWTNVQKTHSYMTIFKYLYFKLLHLVPKLPVFLRVAWSS